VSGGFLHAARLIRLRRLGRIAARLFGQCRSLWGSPLARASFRALAASAPRESADPASCLVWTTRSVYVSHPAALANLRDFLQRAECVVNDCNAYDLEVALPHAPTVRQGSAASLTSTWQAGRRCTGMDAYVVETDKPSSAR
jgi:hypothetical protein